MSAPDLNKPLHEQPIVSEKVIEGKIYRRRGCNLMGPETVEIPTGEFYAMRHAQQDLLEIKRRLGCL